MGPLVKTVRWKRMSVRFLIVSVILYIILLIPEDTPVPPVPAARQPFFWNQDQRWEALEERFSSARKEGCGELGPLIRASLGRGDQLLSSLGAKARAVDDTLFDAIEENIFSLGPVIAACPGDLVAYVDLVNSMRSGVKAQSAKWDMNAGPTRNRLYRLLYGGRAALEEVVLQAPPGSVPASIPCFDEPSSTPSDDILGIRVHSGDILVSRGGAPTSALIARGNDYPGNFSHVALVYVDSLSRAVSIIESHIEKGVAIATIGEYLRDTKLRVMVLRLRADLPPLVADPMLPHRVAALALHNAKARHIPYDFAMDFQDSTKLFCSEVVSSAYRAAGVQLWMGLSSISSPGVCSWLSAFGVRHFQTEEPSDLEYDPQMRVVAEWRAPDELYRDHVDNAVIDAMLEKAEKGEGIQHAWYLLPLARVLKGYSWILNLAGGVGPVPEGMSATAALKHKSFAARHSAIKERVLEAADRFKRENGYAAPYWELLKLARQAAASL